MTLTKLLVGFMALKMILFSSRITANYKLTHLTILLHNATIFAAMPTSPVGIF
jgi:hypothetical protein